MDDHQHYLRIADKREVILYLNREVLRTQFIGLCFPDFGLGMFAIRSLLRSVAERGGEGAGKELDEALLEGV
jgi:hypothetical protein